MCCFPPFFLSLCFSSPTYSVVLCGFFFYCCINQTNNMCIYYLPILPCIRKKKRIEKMCKLYVYCVPCLYYLFCAQPCILFNAPFYVCALVLSCTFITTLCTFLMDFSTFYFTGRFIGISGPLPLVFTPVTRGGRDSIGLTTETAPFR